MRSRSGRTSSRHFAHGRSIDLDGEFELIALLSATDGRVLECEEIHQRVCDYTMIGDRSVDVFVPSCNCRTRRAGWQRRSTARSRGYVVALRPAASGALDFAATHTYSVCMAMIIDVKRDAVEGLWRVMKEGGARASARKETQEMAKQAAITIARRTGAVVRVWSRDGSKFIDLTIPRS